MPPRNGLRNGPSLQTPPKPRNNTHSSQLCTHAAQTMLGWDAHMARVCTRDVFLEDAAKFEKNDRSFTCSNANVAKILRAPLQSQPNATNPREPGLYSRRTNQARKGVLGECQAGLGECQTGLGECQTGLGECQADARSKKNHLGAQEGPNAPHQLRLDDSSTTSRSDTASYQDSSSYPSSVTTS